MGSPVVGPTGSSSEPVKFGLGLKGPPETPVRRGPVMRGLQARAHHRRPAPVRGPARRRAPPHWMPIWSSAFWVVMTMVAAICTWGSGMSSCSLISRTMRSRSFS